jgi:hypothetical protein
MKCLRRATKNYWAKAFLQGKGQNGKRPSRILGQYGYGESISWILMFFHKMR